MSLIDQLNPSKNVYLPNSEELVTMILVPQGRVFALNKEVRRYLKENDLLGDGSAEKQVVEAAYLVQSIRKSGTVRLQDDERGESVFKSIDSFLNRFDEDQANFLMAHYELLKKEAIPPITDLSDGGIQKLFDEIDAGKDVSPQLKSFDFASLLTFTNSLVSRCHQLREASQTPNSRTGFFLGTRASAKRPSPPPPSK